MSTQSPVQMLEKQRKKFASYGIQLMTKLAQVFNEMTSICNSAALQFSKDIVREEDYQTFSKFRVSDSHQEKIPVVKEQPQSKSKDQKSPFQKMRRRKAITFESFPPQQIDKTDVQPKVNLVKQATQRKPPSHSTRISTTRRSTTRPQMTVSPPLQRSSRRSQRILEEKNEHISTTFKVEKSQRLEKSQEQAPKSTGKEKLTPQKNPVPQPVTSNAFRLSRPKIKDPILEEKQENNNEPLGERVNKGKKRMNVTLSLSESDVSSEPSDYRSRRQSSQRRKGARVSSEKRKGKSRKMKRPQLKQGEIQKKRPVNGFMRFFQEVKDEVKRKNKITKLPDLSHMISVQWKKLTKKEQQKYNDEYYSDMKKMKAEALASKQEEKQDKIQDQNNQDQSHLEYEEEVVPPEDVDENDEQQQNQDQVSQQESVSSSSGQQDVEEQQKTPESQKKQRKIHKVKRPSPEGKNEDTAKKSKQEESESEQFSISEQNNQNSNSQQQNSESLSAQKKKAKSPRTTSKSQKQRKSSGSRRKD